MNNLLPPAALSLTGNKSEQWRKWRLRWDNYVTATGLGLKEAPVQRATFLHILGEEGLDIYDGFTWTEDEDHDDLQNILRKFHQYCVPKKNLTIERHSFNTRVQTGTESFEDYEHALRKLAKNCEFGILTDSLIKDRLVAGINNHRLRERLLERPDLTLDGALQLLKAAEASKLQASAFGGLDMISKEMEVEIDRINVHPKRIHASRQPHKPETQKNSGKGPNALYKWKDKTNTQYSAGMESTSECTRCGYKHDKRRCPAYGNTCFNCGNHGHFIKMCRFKTHQVAEVQRPPQTTSSRLDENLPIEEKMFFIGELLEDKKHSNWWETIKIHGKEIVFKLDTGAECNILTKQVYDSLTEQPLHKSVCRLQSYTKDFIRPVGQVMLPCICNNTEYMLQFQVIDGNYTPVIGSDDCIRMKMVTRVVHEIADIEQKIKNEYHDIFEGEGKIPGMYHIHLDEKVTPTIHPPRRIPFAYEGQLKEELGRLEKAGIIEKVPLNEPSEWVHSLVIAPKPNGGIRICIDPRSLNLAIKREHHPLRTVEEVAGKVAGAKYFSVLDAQMAFHQIQLDEYSSKILTFNTPFGRYRYKMMPMGIKSASEIYQRRAEEIFGDCNNTETSIDDTLIWGITEREHDERLMHALQKVKENNLKLKWEKCQFKKSQVIFLGHLFTKEGLKPLPQRCTAIMEMEKPNDKAALQRFLGMVNYVSKFIPNLSELSAPLRVLLHKDILWHWSREMDESFNSLKLALVNPPVLAFYNAKSELLLQVDASSKGMGACLMQNEQPIAYASKALTPTQQNYSQMEKEMLAILFGCDKFETYIMGRDVIIHTDHKPLESIIKKPIHKAPLRLQRMLLHLWRYPGVNVAYKKGSQIVIADTLSRACAEQGQKEPTEDIQIDLLKEFPISMVKLVEFRSAVCKDNTLKKLKEQLLLGWPEEKALTPLELRPYWTFRDELSEIDGILLKGEKLVVPESLRKEMLTKLHVGHMGIVKTKQRARDNFYWPSMNKEIEETIKNCLVCLRYSNANCKEPMVIPDIPNRPWSKVATDLLHFKGKNYLTCVDYYSKFPELIYMKEISSGATITALKSIFARHGIPDEVVSDNGPQYNSVDFKKFAEEWSFTHTTSSPYYPKSNGQAEKTVQTLKHLLLKAEDPYLALLEYRNTPLEHIGLSPAQVLMSRRLNSVLPTTTGLLLPETHGNIENQLRDMKEKQKEYYDRSAHVLPEIHVGDSVGFQSPSKEWVPAVVTEVLPFRQYKIVTKEGRVYRRNRAHLKHGINYSKENREQDGTDYRDLFEMPPRTGTDAELVDQGFRVGYENRPSAHAEVQLQEQDAVRPILVNGQTRTRSGRITREPNRLDL